MITAIEIVISEDLPIAVDDPLASSSEMKLVETERLELPNHVAEIFGERQRVGIEVHKNKFLPNVNGERNQAVLFAIKVLNSIEVGNALERSVQPISPAMIRTLQTRRRSARLGHYRSSVMSADVEEPMNLCASVSNNE